MYRSSLKRQKKLKNYITRRRTIMFLWMVVVFEIEACWRKVCLVGVWRHDPILCMEVYLLRELGKGTININNMSYLELHGVWEERYGYIFTKKLWKNMMLTLRGYRRQWRQITHLASLGKFIILINFSWHWIPAKGVDLEAFLVELNHVHLTLLGLLRKNITSKFKSLILNSSFTRLWL